MQALLIQLPFFLTLLLSGTISYTMQHPETGFLDLPSDFDPYIGSLMTPETISNFSITCQRLHKAISFQTPDIWNLLRHHRLGCIGDNKLPQLLMKTRLCKENTTSDKEKKFFEDIEQKILARYNPTSFKTQEWISTRGSRTSFNLHRRTYFNPFLENQSSGEHISKYPSLFSACFTNDINIVKGELRKNNQIPEDLLALRHRLMEKEQTLILPIICEHYAPLFEYEFTFDDFRWTIFFANVAILKGKYKSFEVLINHHKKYLNRIDANNMTYLDFLIACQNEGLIKHCGAYYYEENAKTMRCDNETFFTKQVSDTERETLTGYPAAHYCVLQETDAHQLKSDLKWLFGKTKSYSKAHEKYMEAHDKCGLIVMNHGGKMTVKTMEKPKPSKH